MPLFEPFKKATQAKAPNLIAAEKAEMEAKSRALRERNQNIIGAASLYNSAAGKRSPIADYIFGGGAGAGTAEAAAAGMAEAGTAEAITAAATAEAAGAAGAGGMSGAMAAGGPYAAALVAALYADDQLLDGKVLDAHEDILGGMFGKGWLWS